MGIGGSNCSASEDWQCEPALPGVQALSCLFFKGEGCQWDAEAAKLIALAENRAPASQHSQALVDRDWWQEHVASTDEDAARTAFEMMATDPAGRQINLYEVLSCAVALSPHLRTDTKLAILWGLWGHEEGAGSHFGVDKATDLCCSLLLGLHRLSVLVPSPPERADVENDICRLIWILRKQQPVRSDVFAFEEVLFISDLDAAIRDFFAKFQGTALQELPEICSSELPPDSRIVDAAGRGLRRGGRGGGRVAGRGAVGRSGRGASRREHSAPRHGAVNATAAASSAASGVSATTASAVLSRRDVLEAFDLFKEIRAEQERLPRRGGSAQPRDTSAIRAVSKIKNAQVQLAVKRLLSRGQILELRDFLRMLALSKAPAAFTEAHLRVFEVWIMDRVQLTDSELIKYRLDKAAEPSHSAGKPVAGESTGQHAAGRRRLHTLFRRAQAPAVQAWLQRQRSALLGDRKARSPTGGQDLTITLEQAVTQGVMPPELATAAARTFGWEASHVLTEGCFLELFVPCAPNDYHSLDFMRGFRRAWLAVNEGMDDSAADLSPEKGAAADGSWLFEEGEGLQLEPSMDLELPSRPSSAPAAPRCSVEERRVSDVSNHIILSRPPAPLPPSHPSSEPDLGTGGIDGIPHLPEGSATGVHLGDAHEGGAPSTPPRPTRPVPLAAAPANEPAAASLEGNAPPSFAGSAGIQPPSAEQEISTYMPLNSAASGGAASSGAAPRVVGIAGIAAASSPGSPEALGKDVGNASLSALGRSPAAHSAGSYEEDTFEEFSEASGPAASPKPDMGGGAAGASTSIPTSIPSLSAARLEDSMLEAPPADVSYEDIVRRSTRSADSSRASLGVESGVPLSAREPDSARLSVAEEPCEGSQSVRE